MVELSKIDHGGTAAEIAAHVGITTDQAKGVMGSLCKKGVAVADHWDEPGQPWHGTKIFNFATEDFAYVGICGWDNYSLKRPALG